MRGAEVKYFELGKLMREGRERAGLNLSSAASMLGLINDSYLSRCELGTCNFPLKKIARASELYGIPHHVVIDKIMDDYKAGMQKALK